MRRSTADLMLLVTVTLWAFNFTVSKYILDEGFHPLAYSSIRYGIAGLLFAALTLMWEGSLRISRRELPLIVFCVLVLFANQLSFVYSLRFTTATTVALLFGTLPIFTALFATRTRVEQLHARFWLAAGVSFSGVALVAIGSGGDLSSDLKGDGLAIAGAATWAAYSVAIAPLMQRYSPFRLSAVFLVAAAMLLLLAGSQQLGEQSFDFGALVWVGFVFAVIGPLFITNLLWFGAIDRVGPSRASLFANLQPFLAAIVALLLLSEKITAVQVVGGLAIGAGILLASGETAPQAGGDLGSRDMYGFLQLCADRRFHRLTMQEFERLTGLSENDYWIEASAGGAPSWSEPTKTGLFAYDQGARVMCWAAHGDQCGGFPGVSNEEMRRKVEESMNSRAAQFPDAEHIALFAHEGGVELVARQNAK